MEVQALNFLKVLNTAIHNHMQDLIEPDWNRMYYYAIHHSVLPIFCEGCSKYQEFHSLSDDIKNKYLMESIEYILGQAQRTEAFLQIYDKLIASGIQSLVLKGLVCRNTYGELGDLRPSGDEDIYIKYKDFEKCRKILELCGFTTDDVITEKLIPEIQHICFSNSKYHLKIEVHLSLMGKLNHIRRKLNTYFEDAFDSCISYEINGHQIYTLNHTKEYLFLFFHYYKHFITTGVGIRQMIDILMYDKAYHEKIDWIVIEESIKEMSAGSLYADVIGIGNQYLGFELRTNLKGYNLAALIEDTMETGTFGNSTREQVLSRNITAAALNNNKSTILSSIFPHISVLRMSYPILFDMPYLLPFYWVKRWFRFLLKKDKEKGKIITESVSIGRRRVKLLKDYRILS